MHCTRWLRHKLKTNSMKVTITRLATQDCPLQNFIGDFDVGMSSRFDSGFHASSISIVSPLSSVRVVVYRAGSNTALVIFLSPFPLLFTSTTRSFFTSHVLLVRHVLLIVFHHAFRALMREGGVINFVLKDSMTLAVGEALSGLTSHRLTSLRQKLNSKRASHLLVFTWQCGSQ